MMVCEMMSKCDESISWTKLQQLPLQTLAKLSNKITTAIGTTQGGGVLGIMTLAESDEGQFLFHLMKELSLTPEQWREMDIRDRVFLFGALSESNRRHNNQVEQSNHQARHSALRRR